VVTTALIRPPRASDVQVKSVKTSGKTRGSQPARPIGHRKGAEMLHIGLDELIDDTIKGMQEVAEAIGLRGNPT
jgi:predicted hydrolase (HD superfamily)